MKMKFLFTVAIIGILSSCVSSSGLNTGIPGYVVTIRNDTIYGKLKLLSKEASCQTIKFADLNGMKRKFRMEEVKAYNRGHDLYFKKRIKKSRRSIWSLGGKLDVFMKLVDPGKIRLFEYHYTVEDEDYTENESWEDIISLLTPDYAVAYYLERNGNLQLVPKIGFRKNMIAFFADSDELVNRIGNRELGFRNIKQIVRIYNRK